MILWIILLKIRFLDLQRLPEQLLRRAFRLRCRIFRISTVSTCNIPTAAAFSTIFLNRHSWKVELHSGKFILAAFNSIFNNDFSYINPQYSHFLNHISTVKRGFNSVFNRVSKTVWKLWLIFYSFVIALPLLFQQLYVIMILYYYRRVSFFSRQSPVCLFNSPLPANCLKLMALPCFSPYF